jgi:hypothetical protein
LDHTAKAIEIEDIEARLSELERAMEASKNGNCEAQVEVQGGASR